MGQSVQGKILYEMQQGIYRDAKRLPRENELAEQMHISRTQLRDSLAQLEREGYISRRQGIGTIINRHVLQLGIRMDLEVEFCEMVQVSGFEPSVRVVCVEERFADAAAAERLGIAEGAPLLYAARVVMADGRPVIFCEDCISCAIIKDINYVQEELHAPIFEFLRHRCGADVYMDLTEVHAVPADARLAALLCVEEGTALLHMDEVDYDIEGRPVLHAMQYYVDGVIRHSLMRRKF